VTKRGKCGKNKPFKKAGLTPYEKAKVERTTAADKQRWQYLFSINKWKIQTN
jgi:hypothetical protein